MTTTELIEYSPPLPDGTFCGLGYGLGFSFDWARSPQNRLDRTISYISAVPPPLTVAAPTCRGCGAIRAVGTLPARCRGRRLRQSALPAHPGRRGRPTRRPPLRLSWKCRLPESSPSTTCGQRSEEHTSELQSPDQLVCRLL